MAGVKIKCPRFRSPDFLNVTEIKFVFDFSFRPNETAKLESFR